jgi:predicted RNase H-like HicB family nuclease
MRLLTIVEDYILAVMKRGVAEQLPDGTFVATAPDAPGVVASGVDIHDAGRDLYARLERWVQSSLARKTPLPIVGGIDLSSEASLILATYHRPPETPAESRVFLTSDEFEAALADPSLRR